MKLTDKLKMKTDLLSTTRCCSVCERIHLVKWSIQIVSVYFCFQELYFTGAFVSCNLYPVMCGFIWHM
jgi:hypothetical protein